MIRMFFQTLIAVSCALFVAGCLAIVSGCGQDGFTSGIGDESVVLECRVNGVTTYRSKSQDWIHFHEGEYYNHEFSYSKSNNESCSVEPVASE